MTSIPTTPEGSDDSLYAYEDEENACGRFVSASDFSGEAHTASSVSYLASILTDFAAPGRLPEWPF